MTNVKGVLGHKVTKTKHKRIQKIH